MWCPSWDFYKNTYIMCPREKSLKAFRLLYGQIITNFPFLWFSQQEYGTSFCLVPDAISTLVSIIIIKKTLQILPKFDEQNYFQYIFSKVINSDEKTDPQPIPTITAFLAFIWHQLHSRAIPGSLGPRPFFQPTFVSKKDRHTL